MKVLLSVFFSISIFVTLGADYRTGNTLTISEQVNSNLYAAASTITLQAPVKGDFIGAGSSILVSDSIEGDVAAACSDILLDGVVNGDARLAAGTVRIQNDIRGDLIVFSGNVYVGRNVTVWGDLLVFAGEVTFEGTVKGNQKITGEKIVFSGQVNGASDISGEHLEIRGTLNGPSRIAGQTITLGDSSAFYSSVHYWQQAGELNFNNHLKNTQAVFDKSLKKQKNNWGQHNWIGFFIVLILAALVSALIFLIILERFAGTIFKRAGTGIQDHFAGAIGKGLLFFILSPALIVICFLTIIGIPLGFFLLLLFIVLVIPSSVFTALTWTNFFMNRFGKEWKPTSIIFIALGIFILLKLILAIPFLGFLAVLLAVLATYGSLIESIREGYQKQKES